MWITVPGFKLHIRSKLDDELHADSPIANTVARWHPNASIYVAADRPHWSVADYRQGCMNVHARRETGIRITGTVNPLVEKTHSQNFSVFDQRLTCRHARPDLHRTARHQLRCPPTG